MVRDRRLRSEMVRDRLSESDIMMTQNEVERQNEIKRISKRDMTLKDKKVAQHYSIAKKM